MHFSPNKLKKHPIKPMVLIILDGFGFSKVEKSTHNAIRLADTPTLDALWTNYPHTLLRASGNAVGLPKGQMGNSEAGHLHIGSGRKILQDLTRIDKTISTGEFFKNPILIEAIKKTNQQNKSVHIIGLLSNGGVHSRDTQISAMIKLAYCQKAKKIYLHAILDGRDTPPKSAISPVRKIEEQFRNYSSRFLSSKKSQIPQGKIASLIGRYYAMDRDKHWNRTRKAYDLLTQGIATRHTDTAEEALSLAYEQDETDEFIKPTSIHDKENPIIVQDGDTIVFMNLRGDRARQLTKAFVEEHFTGFERKIVPKLTQFVTLTTICTTHPNVSVAFPSFQLNNTLGEYLSTLKLRQLRIAETEKYDHVTRFLNGGQKIPFPGEDWKLIPSPRVPTYDLQPEMSANAITDNLVKIIKNGIYNLIVCNFANPDMVGHTGNKIATQIAVHTVDNCLKRILKALQSVGGEALITADHGNAEKMFDENTRQPHTAHTKNPTPLIYVGRKVEFQREIGALYDVAPTLLFLMGIEQPSEMTGRNLVFPK
ncbi:2,3-bisphosphoglycerate-independent phosphoglycerate mutase [Coxiella endosymbiont of Amblyomma sculptum]|uniref:2,3-bisphosphoglycerate-independent phosphoglycerate mutase n=1 Tax=Coxiella endosymbiont of Amblyomma sculptum TaxID=2487929 RepID=UPI00132EECE5|nr:2,3-bisphosphoglycerate-independent phosphoglycerate mutase [Coxiella endosymbiont of Amblyomma sculptum]QHG92286.1 2,3-bisphosphoglycerate-independent phosphoglycerate mutase [Coxiella endosymbiont of Amblyomma sculptum]